MEFKSLYLKYFFLVQSFCFSLGLIEGGRKFTRKNQPVTFECPVEKQDFKNWQIDGTIINGNANTSYWKANVPPSNVTIINITPLSDFDVTVVCVITNDKIRFYATPLFNDIGNLYSSSETPNAIRDKKFTLECKTAGNIVSIIWYTGNGTVIAKYYGTQNQNRPKYFGSRQETSCQDKSYTLSITNVSLAEDNMSIICSGDTHTSMFNITVFVLPKSVTIKNISKTVPVENQNISYECLIKDMKPEFSVYWLITNKDGTQQNVTKYISNSSRKSGKLTTLSSKLTLTFNRNFKELQCVAYLLGKSEFVYNSSKLIKYPPQVNIHISSETNTVIINCTAFDGNPGNYRYKLKQKWGNATKNTYKTNELLIENPSFNNIGTWECQVSNEDFRVSESSNYKIAVTPIFSSVSNDPKKRNVSIGESVIFKQCFYSHPKSDVKWQKNEELIDSNKYSTTDYLSSEFPFKGSCTSLKIEDIKDNDFGTYTLTVENSKGKVVISFALRLKEICIQKFPVGIIVGCTAGLVLLILLGLLAFKCYKIRGVKRNKDTSSAKGVKRNKDTSSAKGTEDNYATISDEAHIVGEQYAEASDPKYLEMGQRNMGGTYVNVSKKPADMDGTYVNISKKPADDTYANVLKKPSGYQ